MSASCFESHYHEAPVAGPVCRKGREPERTGTSASVALHLGDEGPCTQEDGCD